MRFSLVATVFALASASLVVAKPLKGWHIVNEGDIKAWYHIDGDKWVEKKDIVDALTKAADKKHDNSDKKKVSTKGSYPHVYTNDQGPWGHIEGSSMDNGMYFEFQLGTGQRTPDDPRVVYTIKGDPSDKEKNAGEKKPIETKFIGVMKHGEKNGPFIKIDGQDKKEKRDVIPVLKGNEGEVNVIPIVERDTRYAKRSYPIQFRA